MTPWLVPALLLALLAIGVLVRTNTSHQRQQIERKIADRVGGVDRYVDIGVVLKTVVTDPNGEPLLGDERLFRVVNVQHFGGIVDTKSQPPRVVGPSRDPRIWLASQQQADAFNHDDPEKLAQLIHGSEGAGKTRLLAMWHYRRWIENLGEGREGGQTAPTSTRLAMVRQELFNLFHPSWYRYSSSEDRFTMCDGSRIQLVSTYRQSKAQGSPIQGYNWSWCGRDEMQDQIDVHEDIESRGRSAKNGQYKQLATATNKDDSGWRTVRDVLVNSGKWQRRDLSIFLSPFITKKFVADKKAAMTEREFCRRFGTPDGTLPDLPPALALYFSWSRKRNLRPIPVTARKVSSIVIRKKTGNALHALLAGHDPGSLKGATIYLDAYHIPNHLLVDDDGKPVLGANGQPVKITDHVWIVRGEKMHRRQTTQRSAQDILADVRKRGMNLRPDGECVHVRAQPVGQSEDKPSEDLYRIFRAEGLDVKAAQYKKDGTGTGQIKKDDRIEMVNWLFETGRLIIECDDHGRPVAPQLVAAIEAMERDEKGRAETEKKDENDLSDCPAALGYALWPFEKASASELRADVRRNLP